MNDFNRSTPGKSTADARMREGFSRMSKIDRQTSLRSVFMRGRFLEAKIDWHQLPLLSSRTLVNPAGKFYFIVGLSQVGGGDIVRP